MRELIIRVDAGGRAGFGHAMRSLSIAKFLREHYGIAATFYSNPYAKLEDLYRLHGFECVLNDGLSEMDFLRKMAGDTSGSTILIDRLFPFNGSDIRSLESDVKTVMLGNVCEGMYECDYAIFPSAHLSDRAVLNLRRSNGRAKVFSGLDFVVIDRPVIDFLDLQKKDVQRPYVAVTTGASDPEGILIQVLRWIRESDLGIPVKALYGFDFCHKTELRSMLPGLGLGIEAKEFNYSDLFSSRLALSAFGITTYELIYANIPVITVGHAEPNDLGGRELQRRYGCNFHLGLFREVGKEQLISCIRDLWNREGGLAKMRRNQAGLIDGGGLRRIAQIVFSCCAD